MAKASGSKSGRSGAASAKKAAAPRAGAKPAKKGPAPKKAATTKKSPTTKKAKPAPKPAKAKAPAAKKPAAKPAKAAKPVAKKAPAKASAPAKPASAKGAAKPKKAAPPAKAAKPAKEPKAPKAPKPAKGKKAAAPKEPKAVRAKPEREPIKEFSMDEARAAASKLAASAGLAPIQSGSSADANAASRKPRSSKSPLTKKEIEEYKQLLLLKRSEIVGDVSAMETEALTGGGSGSLSNLPQHMADQGSDAYDQSLSLDLAASQRKLLKEIDAALERIDNGTYGVCEMMGVPIGKARLNAKPWAKYCIEAARQMEMRPYIR